MSMATEEQIRDALKLVNDPELNMSVVDLGLIYEINRDDEGNVDIKMTLTTPACPLNEYIPEQIRNAVAKLEGIKEVNVDLVWEPRWTPEMMSEEAKQLMRWSGYNV